MYSANTKALLAYLVKQHKKASVTVLMKLSYLIDLISVKEAGKQLSDFNYIRYVYGPYDFKINKIIDDLVNEKVIVPSTEYTVTHDEYIVYSFNEEKQNFNFDALRESDLKIVDEVLKQLMGYGAKMLSDIAYKTKPMKALQATRDNSVGIGKKLDLKCD
jgi:hypothetical protein